MEFSETGHAFSELVLARHPEWRAFVKPYQPTFPEDSWQPGSFWLDMLSPRNPSLVLWTIVQASGKAAELHLRHRNAEQEIDWVAEQTWDFRPDEQREAFAAILAFIECITTGEIVVVSQRHRFLWRTGESHSFRVSPALNPNVKVFTWLDPDAPATRSG